VEAEAVEGRGRLEKALCMQVKHGALGWDRSWRCPMIASVLLSVLKDLGPEQGSWTRERRTGATPTFALSLAGRADNPCRPTFFRPLAA
jgi:hypothetical protein